MILAFLNAGQIGHLLISSDYIGRVNTSVGEVNGYPGPLRTRRRPRLRAAAEAICAAAQKGRGK